MKSFYYYNISKYFHNFFMTLLEIRMHLIEITNSNIQAQKDEVLLQKLHNQQFSDWLRK